MMSETSNGWINIVPAAMSSITLGETGKHLGYYYDLARYLVIVPIVFLLLVAIVYNVFVAIATVWMYKHAWRKSPFTTLNRTTKDDLKDNVPIVPGLPTTAWEELFTVNIKIANYLLGGVDLKDHDGYLVLQIHDYIVHMPLAIIFIQVCEVAVSMVLVVLFVDYLVLQVTHSCDIGHSGVDCFDTTDFNMSSPPLQCRNEELIESMNISKFTCFHLSLNPVIASAVTGGFLKFAPSLMFSTMTYAYLKMLHFTHYFKRNFKINLASHIAVAVIAEFIFLGAGVTVLVLMLKVESLRTITFETANPMHQMTIIFCFIFYFLASSFVVCVYPLTETAVRFQSSAWKQKLVAARGTRGGKGRGKSPLRPWIVVDPSLNTEDRKLLTDEED